MGVGICVDSLVLGEGLVVPGSLVLGVGLLVSLFIAVFHWPSCRGVG